MIYDKRLWLCAPPAGAGAPFQGRLVKQSQRLYGDRTVYHRRYWEAVQAGSRVDKLIRLPDHLDVTATDYAVLTDGHAYRIEQVQHMEDEDGLPVTELSLRRMEGNYDLSLPAGQS